MIDNPIIQSLTLIGFGFFAGITITLFYIFLVSKNTLIKTAILISSKFNQSNLTFEEFWSLIESTINKTIKVKQDEEKNKTFHSEIEDTHH